MGEVKHRLGDVFEQFIGEYKQQYTLTAYQQKVVDDIHYCRTEAMGGHWTACTNCGELKKHYNFPILGTGFVETVIVLHARASIKNVGSWNAATTCCR